MKVWSREERYRELKESDTAELEQLHNSLSKSIWRTQYHVQTLYGLLNDPNGFCFYNGRWHLFYQWFPFGAVHGLKYWYHVTSEDLVHWTNIGIGLKPDTWYDNKGCYSGSSFVEEGLDYIAYTGNNRDEKWVRHPYQMLAAMNEENRIIKHDEPIIEPDPDYTEHQRDPKLFKREEDSMYYILLGAQSHDKKGHLVLYRSASLYEGWKKLGELKVRGYDDFGYMCECPDIEKIGDKYVLLFSPQGIEPDGDQFRNKFNNVYLIGDLDLYHMEFIPDGPMRELDRGFDFYAAQCACQTRIRKTAVLEGWFGCADYTYGPTDEEGWSGLMTLPRMLTIEDGKLYQKPVPETESLKKKKLFEAKKGSVSEDSMHALMPRSAILEIDNPEDNDFCFNLFTWGRDRGFEIRYDSAKKRLTIDKSDMRHVTNAEFGTDRSITLEDGVKALQVFVDHSAVEIFVNHGEAVMSARIFPDKDETMIRMGGRDIDVRIYEAGTANDNTFIL
jgi:beta-fructofuranosidase